MAIARAAFGKRNLAAWTPSETPKSIGVNVAVSEAPPQASFRASSPDAPILRIERSWFDAAQGAAFIFLGTYLLNSALDNPFLWLMASGLIGGGILILANHFFGTAKLVVDSEGFRNEGLLLSKEMRWQDLHSFQITTVNWSTTVNAKSLKAEGSSSNVYVHVPNSAFKMKSLEFVKTLLAHRPDMASATHQVMDHLGVAHLIKNENRKAR